MRCILLFPFGIGLHIIQFHHHCHIPLHLILSAQIHMWIWILRLNCWLCGESWLRILVHSLTFIQVYVCLFFFFIFFSFILKLFTIPLNHSFGLLSNSYHYYVCDLFPFNLNPDYAIDRSNHWRNNMKERRKKTVLNSQPMV